jgi:hypothetical protein
MPRGVPNTDAQHNPVNLTKTIEAMEMQHGQDNPRVMKSTGPAREALEAAQFEVVDRPVDLEKLAMLAFMEELVEVEIHTTADPTAEQIFEVGNNGNIELFKRGERKTVKRKFVNELATRKVTTFTQERRRNERTGVMEDVQIPHTSLRYPFSVTHDDHPRGRDWLRATLAQP